ncbi:MAG: hypothetical protein U5J64_05550 [Halobacteriales archaeon]|nr:hypothetical protein [Halobacteriales archaeon]
MYEFVHAAPETRTTPTRMALTAASAGYNALVLRNHTDTDEHPSFDVPEDTPIHVHVGVEVRADGVEELHETVKACRRGCRTRRCPRRRRDDKPRRNRGRC